MTDTDTLRSTWLARVADAADAPALEEVRLAALGKKGEISGLMKELGFDGQSLESLVTEAGKVASPPAVASIEPAKTPEGDAAPKP